MHGETFFMTVGVKKYPFQSVCCPPVKISIPSLTVVQLEIPYSLGYCCTICTVGTDPEFAKIAGDPWLYRHDVPDRWDGESVE
jgi:hypothetical protein